MQLSLYASQHFQTCGILTVMTSESAMVSDFSSHVFFAVKWHRICDLTVSMIDKTSSGFNMCHHKNSLPSTLILYRLCENLLECWLNVKYTSQESLKWHDCFNFIVWFKWWFLLLDLNHLNQSTLVRSGFLRPSLSGDGAVLLRLRHVKAGFSILVLLN